MLTGSGSGILSRSVRDPSKKFSLAQKFQYLAQKNEHSFKPSAHKKSHNFLGLFMMFRTYYEYFKKKSVYSIIWVRKEEVPDSKNPVIVMVLMRDGTAQDTSHLYFYSKRQKSRSYNV
jgi:hypothetical protein